MRFISLFLVLFLSIKASANCAFQPSSNLLKVRQIWKCQVAEHEGNLSTDDVCVYKVQGPYEFEVRYHLDLFRESSIFNGSSVVSWSYKRERRCYKGDCSPNSSKQAYFYINDSALVFEVNEWGGDDVNLNGRAVYSCLSTSQN